MCIQNKPNSQATMKFVLLAVKVYAGHPLSPLMIDASQLSVNRSAADFLWYMIIDAAVFLKMLSHGSHWGHIAETN